MKISFLNFLYGLASFFRHMNQNYNTKIKKNQILLPQLHKQPFSINFRFLQQNSKNSCIVYLETSNTEKNTIQFNMETGLLEYCQSPTFLNVNIFNYFFETNDIFQFLDERHEFHISTFTHLSIHDIIQQIALTHPNLIFCGKKQIINTTKNKKIGYVFFNEIEYMMKKNTIQIILDYNFSNTSDFTKYTSIYLNITGYSSELSFIKEGVRYCFIKNIFQKKYSCKNNFEIV